MLITRAYPYVHHSHPVKIFKRDVRHSEWFFFFCFLYCTNPHKEWHGSHRFYVVFVQPERATEHYFVDPLPLTVDDNTARDEQLVLDGLWFHKTRSVSSDYYQWICICSVIHPEIVLSRELPVLVSVQESGPSAGCIGSIGECSESPRYPTGGENIDSSGNTSDVQQVC